MDDCWLFQGAPRNPKGYRQFKYDGKTRPAHRVAWELYMGKRPPDNMQVCHHCDNPPCCNPAHLFLGTNADNVADKMAKGREARGAKTIAHTLGRGDEHHFRKHPELVARGERHWRNWHTTHTPVSEYAYRRKLDSDSAWIIRIKSDAGASDSELAKEFHVTRAAIWAVTHWKCWKEVA